MCIACFLQKKQRAIYHTVSCLPLLGVSSDQDRILKTFRGKDVEIKIRYFDECVKISFPWMNFAML